MLLNLIKTTGLTEIKVLSFLVIILLLSTVLSKILSAVYSHIFGKWGFVFTGWLGVSVHEFSHALFCLIFFHKITKISLFKPGKGENAGFVIHTFNNKNWYQLTGNFFISFAPLFLAPLLSAVFYYILIKSNFTIVNFIPDRCSISEIQRFLDIVYAQIKPAGYRFFVWVYLTTCLAAHMNLSADDLKVSLKGGSLFFIFIFPVLISLIYFFNLPIPDLILNSFKVWLTFLAVMIILTLLLCLIILIFRWIYLLLKKDR